MNLSKTNGFTSYQSTRSKTINSFRVNPEFTFKDKSKPNPTNSTDFNKTHKLQLKIKVNKSAEGIKNIVDKYSSLKLDSEHLKIKSKEQQEFEARKEMEMESINERLEELRQINSDLKYDIQIENAERNDNEKEQRAVADYCNDLKKKFDNIEKTVEEYEKTIGLLNNGNIELQEGYDKKILELENENKILRQRLEERNKLVRRQNNNIRDLEIKSEYIIKDTEAQRLVCMDRQINNKNKLEEIERKYNDTLKRMYEIQMNEDVRKVEMRTNNKKVLQNKQQNESIENEIEIYEKRNKELTSNIKEMSMRFKELSGLDKTTSNGYHNAKSGSGFKKRNLVK
jgi:hypothetical protein